MAQENITKYAILGMISHHPMSGYDIKKRVETSISNFWDISYGQIYPILKKLLQDGLVTMNKYKQDVIPDKKIYTITDEGINHLQDWLAAPVHRETVRFEILLKLFFTSSSTYFNTVEHLTNFQKRSIEDLERFKMYENQLNEDSSVNDDHFYFLQTVLFGKHFKKACIDWSNEVIKNISSRNKGKK